MRQAKRERRIHQVFVTRNTEYHLRRDRCVGVRDRRTGAFYDHHAALYRRVAGAITLFSNGSLSASETLPVPGQAMLFEGEGSLITGPVVAIERPPFPVVMRYPGPDESGG